MTPTSDHDPIEPGRREAQARRSPSTPVVVVLDGVAETALITLYNRGSEARRADRLIDDPLAVELLASIDYPFAERFGPPEQSHVLRSLAFDAQVGAFLDDHPDGTVVSLGEGLETQLWRVDNGTLRWISVDGPELIELRRHLLPAHPRNLLVTASALEGSWTDMLPPGKPLLLLAQGLLMYLTETDVDAFFTLISERCTGATIVFDTIPTWAATKTGHRQRTSYRMPPEPWGTGRRGVRRLVGRHTGLGRPRYIPTPPGRGLAWGAVYPAATRLPLLRGLLPMIISVAVAA